MKDFPAVIVANYFVKKGKEEGSPVEGVLKLIKLVYLAHGWHLGIYGKNQPLIRERVEAWQYGPVVRSVYDAFKYRGRLKITEPATTGIKEEMESIEKLADDDETIEFLDEIWEVYGKYSGPELSKLTHEENTPWDATRKQERMPIHFGVVISDDIIEEYYAGRIKEDKAKEADSSDS